MIVSKRLGVVAKMQSVIIPNFLNEDQCKQLIELGKPHVHNSTSFNSGDGTEQYSDHRTSKHTFLYRKCNPLVTEIEERVADHTGFPLENQEGVQIAHYTPGQHFKPHWDYFDHRIAGTANTLARGGNRVFTFMFYLNTIPEGYGGETYFTQAGMSVRPEMGKACMWANMLFSTDGRSSKLDDTTIHEGRTPVAPYEKWIATIWVREGTFT